MKLSSHLFSILSSAAGLSKLYCREDSDEKDIDEEDIPPCMYGPPPARFEAKPLATDPDKRMI